MTVPRIFLPRPVQKGDTSILRGKDFKYLKSVLRMKTGDHLFLFDGSGYESEAVIRRYTGEEAILHILEKNSIQYNPVSINLFQALTKANTMDMIIQKATEMGVEKIVPFESARSVVRISDEKSPSKVARWQKIATEAARKCGRANIPQIGSISSLDDILSYSKEDEIKLILWEEEEKTTVRQIFQDNKIKKAKVFSVIIGPEGGLSREEVSLAVQRGFTSVSLSNQILKADTAVMAAITIIQYEAGIFSVLSEGR